MTVERSSTPGPFDDAWLKWAWSIQKAQQFTDEALVFLDNLETDAVDIDEQYDAKRHGFALVFTKVPALPARVGLMFGDCVHNLRTSLDHVAWTMVERGRTPPSTLPPGARKRIAFPLCTHKAALNRKDSSGWLKSCRNMLPGVRRDDLALVRSVQPYTIGKRKATNHPLAILSELDNLDKHRQIHPLFTFPTNGNIQIDDWEDCTPPAEQQIWLTGDPIEVGTELGFIRVRRTGPNPTLSVDHEITIDLSVHRDIKVGAWFTATQKMVMRLLSYLAEFPPQVDEIVSEYEMRTDLGHDDDPE